MSDPTAAQPRDAHGMTVGRTATFSDGLFAIAMTLLVLSIDVPKESNDRELWHAIWEIWPQVFGYALSFAVIGRYWVAHHGFMSSIRRVTGGFLALTLLFLGIVAFVSVPTGLIGDTSSSGAGFTAAALFYAGTLTLLGASFTGLQWFALGHDLVYPPDRAELRRIACKSLVAPMVFALSIPLGLLTDGRVASLSWLFIIPLSAALDIVLRKSKTGTVSP